jgi:hypothetical protein
MTLVAIATIIVYGGLAVAVCRVIWKELKNGQ